ncbi:protein-tyrosine kinase 6-like isoform X1 [Xyrauchen texanus]|uniref:protein-tyrosine kinase 6-like isoform X1 n=1 Tax=Xyrauchen texanus TaxID=154827 RepID=UPI002241D0B5|nr:protein-tyrosine kinase 6-like isoform X1 [Xyrauchen texanus]
MGECLRTTCPCLQTVWDRIYGTSRNDGEKGDSGRIDDGPSRVNRDTAIRYAEPRNAIQPPQKTDNAIYTALWDFEARDVEEVSFKAGDMFQIVKRSNEWWTARKIDSNGCVLATGFVPYNYLASDKSIESQPWFFGKMGRVEALSHLMSSKNYDGSFLVRISESDNMGHVLSVKTQNKAKHFKIYQASDGFYIDLSLKFSSVLQVVEYYQMYPLASLGRLKRPCFRKKPQPQDLSHSTADEWELPKDEFTLEEKLGSGFFADVYRGKWKNRINVAIKILKNNDCLEQKEFQMEVQIMKRLRHRHLIALFAICTSSTPYYIITELMEKGNLLNFLRSSEGGALDQVSLMDMAAQVADGMAYLEANNSIHRDLAARNVLVGEGYTCKVADFGLARIIKEPFYISDERKIPYKWTAPEAISHGCFSNKSDVWSFGILLYEILTYGGIPYPGLSSNEVFIHITEHHYRMPAPSKCPQVIYDIMLSCWSAQTEDRPTFKDLKQNLEVISHYNELD